MPLNVLDFFLKKIVVHQPPMLPAVQFLVILNINVNKQ